MTHRGRKHHKRSRRNGSKKNAITGSLNKGAKVANTGVKVAKKSVGTVPYLQQLTRKVFGMFGTKKTARRRHRS